MKLKARKPTAHELRRLAESHLAAATAEIEQLQAGLAKHVNRVCELQDRLAAANALLRTIAAYTPPDHECRRGCPKETCEACKLANYLQGAGDEAV